MIAVMGATGKVGGAVTRALLGAGADVRVIGRTADRLAALVDNGAVFLAGDAGEPGFLSRAFAGADAVFTLLPFDPAASDYLAHQNRLGASIVQAIRASGVQHVVSLSSIGAEQSSGTGVVESLYLQERRLRNLGGVNVLSLRAGSFFENFHAALEMIEQQGFFADTVAPDAPVPMVAVHDIAAVATEALLSRRWEGFRVREVLGPRDLTYAEATRILGHRLGRPDLAYVQLTVPEMVEALVASGFSEDVARRYALLGEALGNGRIRSRQGGDAKSRTETTFEAFAAELLRGSAAV